MNPRRVLILGGTRYFGRRLTRLCIEHGDSVTILTRGKTPDDFKDSVSRFLCDREDRASMQKTLLGKTWDLVFDQNCYSANEAKWATEVLKGHAGRVVYTSSQSVYPGTGEIFEKDFDPKLHPIVLGNRQDQIYPEAKRQAEAIYFQSEIKNLVAVRFPIVLGPDDYTKRLHFFIERCLRGLPIVAKNTSARSSFIHSADAARFLFWLGSKNHTGPVNACSPESISIAEVLHLIESKLELKALVLNSGPQEAQSPFASEESWFMNSGLAKSWGFEFMSLRSWLEPLISELISSLKT